MVTELIKSKRQKLPWSRRL